MHSIFKASEEYGVQLKYVGLQKTGRFVWYNKSHNFENHDIAKSVAILEFLIIYLFSVTSW
jgi:hypothetical protein